MNAVDLAGGKLLAVELIRELVHEQLQEVVLFGAHSVVVNSEQHALVVYLGIEAKKKLADLERSATATFASQHVNILHKNLSERSVQRFSICTVVESHLRSKELYLAALKVIMLVLWWHRLKIIRESILKCKETTFKESLRIAELTL